MSQSHPFTSADLDNPIYCVGCQTHIPRSLAEQGGGLCPTCRAKISGVSVAPPIPPVASPRSGTAAYYEAYAPVPRPKKRPVWLYVLGTIVGIGVIGNLVDPKRAEASSPSVQETSTVVIPAKPRAQTSQEKKAVALETAREKRQAVAEEKARKVEEARQAAIAKEMEPKWRKIKTFSGSSIKNTESFEITGDEWRVDWATRSGRYGAMNFQIYVYNADGSLKDMAANVIGDGHDSSVIRGAGRYYLQFNTAQPYAVEVSEYR